MNKYSKIQATLKALANPAIGIDSISQLALLIELGKDDEFNTNKVKNESFDKTSLYDKLKRRGMFELMANRKKHEPSRQRLTTKARGIYDLMTAKHERDELLTILYKILDQGINRFGPCILLVELRARGQYMRRDMPTASDMIKEASLRNMGLSMEIGRKRVECYNGASYLKSVYGLTDRGCVIADLLISLIDN